MTDDTAAAPRRLPAGVMAALAPLRHPIAGAVAALLVGFGSGVCAVAVHNTWWGFLVAVAGTAGLLGAMRGRAARSLAGAGWLLALFFAVRGRAEGDYAVAANLRGQLLLGLGLVVLVASLWSLARGRGPTPGDSSRLD